MKYVLLTRAEENNKNTIKEIDTYNKENIIFRYLHCPLIKYHTANSNLHILHNYSEIIIASKYAARILINSMIRNPLWRIWVVGRSSRCLLEKEGFKIIYNATNIDELINYFPSDLYDKAIYLSSNKITKELPIQIERNIIYNVKYNNELPNYISQLKNKIDYTLLYSQNSAQTLIKLFVEKHLLYILENSTTIAISQKVADIIRPFVKNVIYCKNSDSRLMVKLLVDHAKNAK